MPPPWGTVVGHQLQPQPDKVQHPEQGQSEAVTMLQHHVNFLPVDKPEGGEPRKESTHVNHNGVAIDTVTCAMEHTLDSEVNQESDGVE